MSGTGAYREKSIAMKDISR